MNKLRKLYVWTLALLACAGMAGCSDDNDDDKKPTDPDFVEDYHFDVWVALGRHGGMARDVQTLVRSLSDLEASQPTITFEGTGAEVNKTLTLETIQKGAYYYQVPVSGDCFGKYVIEDNRIRTIAERRFETNTFAARKYTHAWTDDNTLVIMAANGAGDKVVWTKLNTADMTIVSEGTLAIPALAEGDNLCTSGILSYRASDNKLFYFYFTKVGKRGGKRTSTVLTAVINPSTMAVEEVNPAPIDCETVGSAYGELLQTITFIDRSGNLYLACFSDGTDGLEHSHLLRIPAGKTNFDPAYDGYAGQGKLISVMYIGGDKAMAYARDDSKGTAIDDFAHYYTVLDLKACTATPVNYEGERLAFSSGRFSSRMCFVNRKAYIGVDAEGVAPQIYIYDADNGKVSLGAKMAQGYFFEQIRVVENLK